MLRDDEPTILGSIAAARARLEKAEEKKKAADSNARQAKEDRDREKRILTDRVITATQNAVPQNLIADEAGRTREWVRLTNLGVTYPDDITAIAFPPEGNDTTHWRTAALYVWNSTAQMKGLEPMVIDSFKPKGNQIAQVLVYDQAWILLLDGETVRVAKGNEHYPDPAYDPKYPNREQS